ncbi:MAG: hypothetical protein CFE37_01795 [Alphaproteobacteria bacterium PA4]|nr:MAG: hypothetical protein CFE37_01795 [Alphaproteobacteria bacterium PA4]
MPPARSLCFALLLAGCAATPTPAPVAAPPHAPAPPPPGLSRILGSGAAGVTALLGPASMERSEGPARQLQFIRPACVLDVFLYPPAAGGAPVVRTAAARRPDGSRIDAGACLALLAPAAPPIVPR